MFIISLILKYHFFCFSLESVLKDGNNTRPLLVTNTKKKLIKDIDSDITLKTSIPHLISIICLLEPIINMPMIADIISGKPSFMLSTPSFFVSFNDKKGALTISLPEKIIYAKQ